MLLIDISLKALIKAFTIYCRQKRERVCTKSLSKVGLPCYSLWFDWPLFALPDRWFVNSFSIHLIITFSIVMLKRCLMHFPLFKISRFSFLWAGIDIVSVDPNLHYATRGSFPWENPMRMQVERLVYDPASDRTDQQEASIIERRQSWKWYHRHTILQRGYIETRLNWKLFRLTLITDYLAENWRQRNSPIPWRSPPGSCCAIGVL